MKGLIWNDTLLESLRKTNKKMEIITGGQGMTALRKVIEELTKNKEEEKVNKISRTQAVKLITESKGKFFTVTWKTNGGTMRTINCNAKKDCITGLGYITVYSPKDKGYRTVNTREITELKINGSTLTIK